MTENWDKGFQDGLAGRNNEQHSPNYSEGWEAGWYAGMLMWNNAHRPAGAKDTVEKHD